MASVAANLATIRRRIEQAGGDAERITIVAVTKKLGPEVVAAALDAGLPDVGENYAQDLVAKATAAPPGARWHFLGAVQRNKINSLAPHVVLWHGLDRVAAVDALAARCPGAAVLIEVNAGGEPSKAGCGVGFAPELVEHARVAGLEVRGLMTVAPRDDPRHVFRTLARLRDELDLVELSMGMSNDFEVAVQEGATILRIGTALFGPRPV